MPDMPPLPYNHSSPTNTTSRTATHIHIPANPDPLTTPSISLPPPRGQPRRH